MTVIPPSPSSFESGWRAWALGFPFGGAVIFLLASMGKNFNMH